MLNCQNSYIIKENVWLTFKIVIITNILVRYLNPEDHHLARIGEIGKDFARKFDFKDTEFSQILRYSQCWAKKKMYQHQCFWLWKLRKILNLCLEKIFKLHNDLLLIEKERRPYCVLIRSFNNLNIT